MADKDNIVQDIKIVQAAVKAALSQSDDKASVNILNIGQIRINHQNLTDTPPDIPKHRLQSRIPSEGSLLPEYVHQDAIIALISDLLKLLPEENRWEYLNFYTLSVAQQECGSVREMARFLGVPLTTLQEWIRKLDLQK